MTVAEWSQTQTPGTKKYLFPFERQVNSNARADGRPDPDRTPEEWESLYAQFDALMRTL